MRSFYRLLSLAAIVLFSFNWSFAKNYDLLKRALSDYLQTKDARIGVCLLIDSDTIQVNGFREFPMLSVYKFPLALNVAEICRMKGISFGDTIHISKAEILPHTWSPLREKYGMNDLRLPLSEILALALQQSDNNACDILFSRFGGPAASDSLMNSLGFDNIHIYDTEADMHSYPSLCYRNRATPIQLSSLMRKFYEELRGLSIEYQEIASMMEYCGTGLSRISAGLPPGSKVGHKTGTGDINHEGRISAVNDVAYIILPDESKIYLTVLVSDALCSYPEAESYIADITKLIVEYIY